MFWNWLVFWKGLLRAFAASSDQTGRLFIAYTGPVPPAMRPPGQQA